MQFHCTSFTYTTTITLSKMGEWGIYPVPSSAAPAYDNWENSAYLFSSTLCIKKVISDVNVHFSKLAEKYFVTTHKVHFKIALFFLILDYCASIWGDSHCKSFKKSQKDSMLFQQQPLLEQQKKRTPFRLFCIAELILCLWVKNINKQTYEFWK